MEIKVAWKFDHKLNSKKDYDKVENQWAANQWTVFYMTETATMKKWITPQDG